MDEILLDEDDGGGEPPLVTGAAVPGGIPYPVQVAFNFIAMTNGTRYRVVPQMAGGSVVETVELDLMTEKAFGVACGVLGRYFASFCSGGCEESERAVAE